MAVRRNYLLVVFFIVPFALVLMPSDFWARFKTFSSRPALLASGPATVREPSYQVQIFSSDPVVLYVRDFLSQDEIQHILIQARDKWEVSRVWTDDVGHVNLEQRDSMSAKLKPDVVVRRIQERGRRFLGWRNNDTYVEGLKIQKYGFGGFYTFHYDWIDYMDEFPGNRVATFMIYLVDNCTGGGTNFPRLQRPADGRWCDVIACEGEEYDEYPGVTFKPVAGSAVFWENMHPNGTPHTGTRHAALPVRSGEKIGLNLWSWDESWRPAREVDLGIV